MNCRTFYGVEIAVMRRFPRPFALGLAVVLATGLLNGVVVRAEAETEFQPRALRRTPSVPVVAVTGAKQDLPPARGVGPQPKPAWPAAATATVALPPRATNRSASAPTQAIRADAPTALPSPVRYASRWTTQASAPRTVPTGATGCAWSACPYARLPRLIVPTAEPSRLPRPTTPPADGSAPR